MFSWGCFISLVENSRKKKKRNEKDPTHKVTDVGSHQRTREPGRGGAVRGPAGARGRVVLAVCSRSPHPLPQPSISSRQQNMTMLAFFISLTLPLIKQWSKRGFAESVLYAPITHDEIISHRIVLKLNDDKNALLFCVHQFIEVYQVINVSWQTARWIQE